MVDNQDKTGRRLAPRNINEIRFLRFCGLTQEAVAERLELTRNIVQSAISKYDLDRPVSELEAVRLEVLAAFRDTNRRLLGAELSAADHARLCATQVKQATALMRPLPTDLNSEDDTMTRKSDAARARLEAMNMEELRNEIRRLAGMELKALADHSERDGDVGRGAASDAESIPDDGDGGPEAADRD